MAVHCSNNQSHNAVYWGTGGGNKTTTAVVAEIKCTQISRVVFLPAKTC